MKKTLLLCAFLVGLVSSNVMALTLDEARTQGRVGETFYGYLVDVYKRQGGNRVDGDNFTGAKRHRSNRAITVNSNHMTPLHCANEGRTKLLRAQ